MRVASLKIQDCSGEISASFWKDQAELVENVKLKTILLVKNAYINTGFSGVLELSSLPTPKLKY